MICTISAPKNLRISAIDNMGIAFKTPPVESDCREIVRNHLACLTPRELEICVLHFLEGRSQIIIGEWLGIALRTVQFHIENAVQKIPQLEPLRVKSLLKPVRPKMFHLSQLRPTERGPFNGDEV